MQFPNMFYVDVDKGPVTQPLHPLFLGDALANRIGVYLYKDGEPFSPGGSAFGRAVLSGGETVLIQNGVVSENAIYVDLPSGVYAEQGPVKITVSWTDGTTTTTVLEGTGNVRLTETGTIIDPGTIISDVTALIQAIETAVASIPPTYTDLLETIAPEFSTDDDYTAGQYVWYDGSLYRFKADHSGSWTGTDAALVTVGGDLQSVDERYLQQTALPSGATWIQGLIYTSTGADASSTLRIRTRIFPAVAGTVCASGYRYMVFLYGADGTYLGVYRSSGTLVKEAAWQTGRVVLRGLENGLYMRIMAAREDNGAITPESGSNMQILVDTDTTMKLPGVPVDGHAAGALLYPAAKNMGRINLFNKNDPDIVTGSYISSYSNGEFNWTSSAAHGETGYIPVEPGDIVVAFYAGNTTPTVNVRVAAYNLEKVPAAIYTSAASAFNGFFVLNGYGFLRFTFTLERADDLMLIKVRPDDPLPFDCAGEPHTPFGGYSLPDVVSGTAKQSEVDELREEIAGQVALGAQWRGKVWYAYGTSITNINSEGRYPTYLAQMSGMTLVNKGISGGGIGNLGANSTGQVYRAICTTTDGKLNADLITLETGANDVNANVPLGTIYDTGTETLAGCLNDCLRYLQANTTAQVAVTNSPSTKTEPNAANKVYEWAQMVEQICRINRVHFLNPDNGMGYARLTSSSGSAYVVDNIHQTNLGGYIMAQNLWYQLRNIPLFYTAIPES
nr:SGNH/GDSL hydrolase family protein [Oscillospiraceae bacterium]